MGELTETNAQAGQKRIFLLGSCVSRDIFEYDAGQAFNIVRYFSCSSFASSTSPTPVDEGRLGGDIDRLASEFQRRVVRADLSKILLDEIEGVDFDYLLTDFIDERFAIFHFFDGEIFTYSVYLSNAGVDPARLDGELIMRATERYFELWEAGWTRFAERLKAGGLLKKVVLNRVFWAARTVDGGDYLPMFPAEYVEKVNHYLGRMYDRAARDLPAGNVLDFGTEFLGAESHRWGREPYHFTEDYYRQALLRLAALG